MKLIHLILVLAVTLVAAGARTSEAKSQSDQDESLPAFSYPIGSPGQALGDGFFIRHAFATENTWYNPGYWHTAEDWYAIEGETAGAGIYAIADGDVVFAG